MGSKMPNFYDEKGKILLLHNGCLIAHAAPNHSRSRDRKTVCLWPHNALNSPNLQHSPREDSAPGGGGGLEPCLGGVGIWLELPKSFQRNICVLSFNMEVIKGKEFTFASIWLRSGLQESHSRWSCLLQKKIDHEIRHLGRAFEHCVGATLIWMKQSSKVQITVGMPGRMLKLRTERRIR